MTILVSPCVSRCCLTEDEVCSGCFRSLSEIMEWSEASSARKQTIIVNAKDRENKQS